MIVGVAMPSPRAAFGGESLPVATIISPMDFSYRPRPFGLRWDQKRLLDTRFVAIVAACICWFFASWLRGGLVLATSSLVGGLVLGLLLRVRSGRVAVSADDRGVRAVGWGSELRWPWDEIASFAYVPQRWHCTPASYSIGTFYTARVTLTNGMTHPISALIGSSTGAKESDAVNRRIIGELSSELERRQARTAA